MQEYLNNHKGFSLSENRIKRFIVELLLAIDYLHSLSVIHRDIKPSNIFLKGKEYTVQLGDFGMACSLGVSLRVEDVGTLLYQSPEILNITYASQKGQKASQGYDCRTDIWSFGCIVFQLCNLDVPFYAPNEQRLIQKIQTGRHKAMRREVSQELKDLYEVCMNKDYKRRPYTRDLLSFPFIQQWAKELNIFSSQIQKYNRMVIEEENTIESFLVKKEDKNPKTSRPGSKM